MKETKEKLSHILEKSLIEEIFECGKIMSFKEGEVIMDYGMVKYLKNKTKVSGKSVIQLSHNQIAEEMGTSRVVISRLLKHLENDKKLLLYRNEIKLLSSF